jgi:acyl-CoA thioester hydrolase
MPHDDNGQLTGTTTIRVRYVECDPMGIVHHSIYPVWLEMGRTELLRDTGYDYRQMEADGAAFAVTALNIRYRASARYDDVLTLRTTLTRVGRARLEHTYELRRDGQILATATTTIGCVDPHGKVRPLPDIPAFTHALNRAPAKT